MRRTVGRVGALLAAVAALVVTAAPAPAGGGTYSVTSTADTGAGSYRQAMADASAFAGPGDAVVTFNPNLVVSVTGGDVQYTGAQALVLNGQGATIDGTDSQRLLRAPNASVTINDLTFNDAGADGAVETSFANDITVHDSTFSSTNSSGDGGAIEANTGDITVTGSTFRDNTVTVDGGALDGSGTITVDTSTFTGNTALNGGAIYAGGHVVVTNSTFSGNTALGGEGGAIRAGGGDTVTVTNSTFDGNTAEDDGGAIRADAAVTLTHVTSSRNSAEDGADVFILGAGVLTSFATVMTQPVGAATNCDINATAVSEGFNRVTDASCGFAGTGDVQGGSPTLGALRQNGGPTATRLPGGGLVDTIPPEDCHLTVLADQRAVVRPQGAGCDVGAVEVDGTYRPDALIRNSNQAAFAGGNVYNLSGANQTRSQAKARGATATFVLRLQNDTPTVDKIRLRAPGTSNRFTVRYKVGAANVTSAVVGGTYRTPLLQPGGVTNVTVQITVRNAAPRGITQAFLATARSDGAPQVRDVVKASVRVA
jgi:predicted outer membrane repeat protein